jgi:hypothetical protein
LHRIVPKVGGSYPSAPVRATFDPLRSSLLVPASAITIEPFFLSALAGNAYQRTHTGPDTNQAQLIKKEIKIPFTQVFEIVR